MYFTWCANMRCDIHDLQNLTTKNMAQISHQWIFLIPDTMNLKTFFFWHTDFTFSYTLSLLLKHGWKSSQIRNTVNPVSSKRRMLELSLSCTYKTTLESSPLPNHHHHNNNNNDNNNNKNDTNNHTERPNSRFFTISSLSHILIITLKGTILDFLQSPHWATY